MLSVVHQLLVALLRARPDLATELWRQTAQASSASMIARVGDPNILVTAIDGRTRNLIADLVITFHTTDDPEGPPIMALVVEVQLNTDRKKLFSWVEYLAGVRRKYQCAGAVMVVSPFRHVIDWAFGRFENEPHLRPALVGPDQITRIDDDQIAAHCPERTILAAACHATNPWPAQLMRGLITALRVLPSWQRDDYIELLREFLPEDTMSELEILSKLNARGRAEVEYMATLPHAEKSYNWQRGLKAGRKEGRQEGRQEALSLVLESLWLIIELRGLDVDDVQRARITSCSDPEQLGHWLSRLRTAERLADVLE